MGSGPSLLATEAPGVMGGMDAVELLENDHRTVDQLFTQYEDLTDASPTARRAPVDRMIRELSVHAYIEEQVVYPVVRDELPDGRSMAEEAEREHEEAKQVLRRLDRMDPTDPGFDSAVMELIRDVRHHVEEEEGEMFPKLRSSLSESRLREMGRRMQDVKPMAPTRP